MKMKIVFQVTLAVALAMFASGCCTGQLLDTFKQRTADTFNPTAVYQTTNRETFALEGTRHNHPEYSQPQIHAYLFIPQKNFASTNFQTGEKLSLTKIKELPPKVTLHLKSKDKLPSNYAKVVDLPKNDINLEIKEHHPGRAVIIFIPFTFACDVVTFPFQLFIGLMMSGGHT
jgi:hypothetical protein